MILFFLFCSLPNLWLITQTDPSLHQKVVSYRGVQETLSHSLYMMLAVPLAGQAAAASFQGNFSLLGVASLFQLS